MSVWDCTCEHCRIWRATFKAQVGAVAAAKAGVDMVEYTERLMQLPGVGELIFDMQANHDPVPTEDLDAFADQLAEDIKASGRAHQQQGSHELAGQPYSDAELVKRAVRSATSTTHTYAFACVAEKFCVGSTIARELCRRFDIDPDQVVGPDDGSDPNQDPDQEDA